MRFCIDSMARSWLDRIERIHKMFGGFSSSAREVVGDVCTSICEWRRRFLALLGPSGCGKTTLLRIIAGLETQTSGRVTDRRPRRFGSLPPRKRGLGMVFQNYAVFPHMTRARERRVSGCA